VYLPFTMRTSVLLVCVLALAAISSTVAIGLRRYDAPAPGSPPVMHTGSSTGVTSCPAGSGVTEYKTCAKCLAGFMKANSDLAGCSPCELGSWSAEGATSCTWCPDGMASPAGSPGCNECDQGFFAQTAGTLKWQPGFTSYAANPGSRGAATCTPCPAGYYQPAARQAKCLPCPSGFTSESGAAMCTTGNTVTGGSSSGGATPTAYKFMQVEGNPPAAPAKHEPKPASTNPNPPNIRPATLRQTKAGLTKKK